MGWGIGMKEVSSVHWHKIINGLVGYYNKLCVLNVKRDRLCFPKNHHVSLLLLHSVLRVCDKVTVLTKGKSLS